VEKGMSLKYILASASVVSQASKCAKPGAAFFGNGARKSQLIWASCAPSFAPFAKGGSPERSIKRAQI
jgi:hypothetical protein